MKFLIALLLGLGTPTLWAASTYCEKALISESILEQAAALELKVWQMCAPERPELISNSCAALHSRLTILVSNFELGSRAAVTMLEKIRNEIEELDQFLEVFA